MKKTKNKISGFFAGILILIAGVILLWFNEGRTAKTETTIKEASKEYTDVSSEKIDKKYENKLIATTGTLDIGEQQVTDPVFQVSVKSAKLYRKVEMYQYKENCETDENDKTICHYDRVWSETLIDSSKFANTDFVNPTEMKYKSATFYNENTKVGAFSLSNKLLKELSTNVRFVKLNQEFGTSLGLTIDNNAYLDSVIKESDSIVKGNQYSIGDIRISFFYNNATTVSIMAIQSNNTFKEYESSSGYKINYLSETEENGQTIITNLTTQNNKIKWILRIMGILFVAAGFSTLVGPIQYICELFPFIGDILSWAIGRAAVFLGIAVSFIIIALAWLRYRPLISIGLLVIAVGIVFICKTISDKKSKKETHQLEQIVIQQPQPKQPQPSTLMQMYSNQNPQPGNPFQNHQISQNITTGAAKPPQQFQQQPVNTNQQQTNNNQINLQEFYHNQQQNNQNNQ